MKHIKTIQINKVEDKLTKDCFISKIFYYRDSDLDNWLPKKQIATPGELSVFKTEKDMTFQEMYDEHKSESVSLVDIENLIERQDGGEDVGLRTDGWANFFFVKNKDGNVSVVFVRRPDCQWHVHVRRLDSDFRWYAEYHVFVRNCILETKPLSPSDTLPTELVINGVKYKKA